MPQSRSITEVLANLILRSDTPLDATAIAGEIVTLDARLRTYGGSIHANNRTLEEISNAMQVYDTILERSEALVVDFAAKRDIPVLLQQLLEIKASLGRLS